ncbi:MAG: hypothetical protein GX295_01525 [Syntrophomonadaceae bacterium]|nr:hypothetical protein [Syntrophomonadaceae bacterium]
MYWIQVKIIHEEQNIVEYARWMLLMKTDPIKGGPIEKIYAIIAVIIGISVLVALFGQLIMIKTPIPPETIVYVDEESHIYYAPPYILGEKYPSDLDVRNLKAMTVNEAKKSNYKADDECVEMGYFREQYTLKDRILIFIGLIQPGPSRWNPDGSWNW